MTKRFLAALLVICLFLSRVHGTSWGLNALGDSVYWSEAIAIVRVKSIERVEKPGERKSSKFQGYANVVVKVRERMKGNLPDEIHIINLDLGDADLNRSPFPPLPDKLVGQDLLVFLTAQQQKHLSYKANNRGLVQNGLVRYMAFSGFREKRLDEMRAIVAELLPIQRACPRDLFRVKDEPAAVVACQKALQSKYREVIWYGARRLLDRPIPAHLVEDLLLVAQREKSSFPVRYLLVQCLAKARDKKAVPVLLEILRADPKDTYVLKALEELTGQKHGEDVAGWQAWWRKYSKKQASKGMPP